MGPTFPRSTTLQQKKAGGSSTPPARGRRTDGTNGTVEASRERRDYPQYPIVLSAGSTFHLKWPSCLRLVVVGGERVSPEAHRRFREADTDHIESTITFHRLCRESG